MCVQNKLTELKLCTWSFEINPLTADRREENLLFKFAWGGKKNRCDVSYSLVFLQRWEDQTFSVIPAYLPALWCKGQRAEGKRCVFERERNPIGEEKAL